MVDYIDGEVTSAESAGLLTDFDRLTAKQHEVFALVAEGRTTKEIAGRLNVTDSAVNQRIEAVRSRAGSPPRAELARAYRRYLTALPQKLTDDPAALHKASSCDARTAQCAIAISAAPDQLSDLRGGFNSQGSIVPKAFAGPEGGLNRVAAMVVIALGLFAAALLCLHVVKLLDSLL